MSRDKVKDEVADAVRWGVKNMVNGLTHRLTQHSVADTETQRVSDLETQVKVIFKNGPPRYFLVKVSEKF